jgi:hypothetical protein
MVSFPSTSIILPSSLGVATSSWTSSSLGIPNITRNPFMGDLPTPTARLLPAPMYTSPGLRIPSRPSRQIRVGAFYSNGWHSAVQFAASSGFNHSHLSLYRLT